MQFFKVGWHLCSLHISSYIKPQTAPMFRIRKYFFRIRIRDSELRIREAN